MRLTDDDLGVLKSYDWPGNIRELQNVIERAVILAKGPRLRLEPRAGAHGVPEFDGCKCGGDRQRR
jgi:DNA-binding NtrC family response regulator